MTTNDPRGSWSTVLGCAVAAVALGQALQAGNGILQSDAIKWLTVTGVATLVAVAAPSFASVERTGSRAVELILAAGLAYQFFQLFTTPPGLYVQPDRAGGQAAFSSGLAAAAVLAGISLLDPRRLGRWMFPALLIVFVYLGRWILVASPDPAIDTYVFQRDAGNALLEGKSPYSLRYPDIYGSSPFYGEGLSVGGVLQFGYPYPPLSLLLTLPAQMLMGDYRYAQLIAIALSAACIVYAKPGRVAMLAALVLLFTPRVFFVLEQGWTDPLVVLGFAASAYCALRWKEGLPWVLGLALAVKQYTIFMVPAARFGFIYSPASIRRIAAALGPGRAAELLYLGGGGIGQRRPFYTNIVRLR